MAPSNYEISRTKNIENNRKLLEQLGLDKPFFEPLENKKGRQSAKRKAEASDDEASNTSAAKKRPKAEVLSAVDGDTSVRRSSRNAGKKVDYTREVDRGIPTPIAVQAGIRTLANEGPQGREDGIRKHDPKRYGAIPDIEVGTWWETRQGCSADAVHAPWVAGIAPGPQGAYSVALSGGYDDDVDLGYAFTYTGSGGRDLKGTKAAPKNLRTAPQSSDQNFENTFNKALKKSCETRKPVRVIRGYKLKSRYAPTEGYRYDGLYVVEKAWIEQGLNEGGFLVCKYAFKRLPDQPPLQVRSREDTNAPRKPSIEDKDKPAGTQESEDEEALNGEDNATENGNTEEEGRTGEVSE